MHVLEHALVIRPPHEALERGERPRRDHVQVGHLARGQDQRLERVEVGGSLTRPIDQRATVWLDETCPGAWHRDMAHAATLVSTRPSSASFSTTICADSSGSCSSVSIRSSGFTGSSYGSDTPVNSLISPLKAFSYRPFTSRRAHSATEAATNTSTKVPCSSTSSRAFWRVSS